MKICKGHKKARATRAFLLRCTVLLTLAALFCGLWTGCGGPGGDTSSEAAPTDLTYAEQQATVHQALEVDISEKTGYVFDHWQLRDGLLQAHASVPEAEGAAPYALLQLSTDGRLVSQTPFSLPAPSPDFSNHFYGLFAGCDGATYGLVEQHPQTDGEDPAPQEPAQLLLCRLEGDALTAQATLRFPAEFADAGLLPAASFQLPDGDFWIAAGLLNDVQGVMDTFLLRFSPQGAHKATVPLGNNVTCLQLLPEGRALFCCNKNDLDGRDTFHLLEGLEGETPTVTPLSTVLDSSVPFFDHWVQGVPEGQAAILTFYGIYSIDPADGTARELVHLSDYGLDPSIVSSLQAFALEDGGFLVVTQPVATAENGCYTFHLLKAGGQDPLAGRQVLTLGLIDYLPLGAKRLISSYNLSEPEVYIRTVDYSNEAARAAGFADGSEMLDRAIVQGNMPDILLLPATASGQDLLRRGVLRDLFPYLDADPEVEREDLVPGALTACQAGDALPTLMPSYWLMSAVGAPEVVGDQPGWSWEAFDETCAQWPQAAPFYGADRRFLLLYHLLLGGDAFVDWGAAQSKLDQPAFVRLLEASQRYPTEDSDLTQDPKDILAGRQALLKVTTLNCFSGLRTLQYEFDGDITFKGFPGNIGTGSAFTASVQLGITTGCGDPDAAWQFVRRFLLPEYQDALAAGDGFALRRDSLHKQAAAACQASIEPALPYYMSQEQLTEEQLAYWTQPLDAPTCEALCALIESTQVIYHYNVEIADMLWEEADAFYHGVRTAQQAADILQDRVQTYLNEMT